MSAFDACRSIPASDVAERIGLRMKQRGDKQWACCPMHKEDTDSLMFDSDGHWYCFGCGHGGNAVAFYGALYNLKPLEAAQGLARMFGRIYTNTPYTPPPVPPERQLRDVMEAWYVAEWHKACDQKHQSTAMLRLLEECAEYTGSSQDECMAWILFREALLERSAAVIRLEELSGASKHYLLQMMIEEQDAKQ